MMKYKTLHKFRATYYFIICAILFTLASIKAFSFGQGCFSPPDLVPHCPDVEHIYKQHDYLPPGWNRMSITPAYMESNKSFSDDSSKKGFDFSKPPYTM